jgi:hypothetical protein
MTDKSGKTIPIVLKPFPQYFSSAIQSAGKEIPSTEGEWKIKGHFLQDVYNNGILAHSYFFVIYNYFSNDQPLEINPSIIVKFKKIANDENIFDFVFIDYVNVGYNSYDIIHDNDILVVSASREWKKDHQKSDLDKKIWFVDINPQNKLMTKVSITASFVELPENENTYMKWFKYSDCLCILKYELLFSHIKWHGTLYYIRLCDFRNANPDSKVGFKMFRMSSDNSHDHGLILTTILLKSGI